MSPPRLRQICLVAPQLEPAVGDLCRILRLAVCYRDPHLSLWGVENAMLPVGRSFLEICAPTRSDAPARRFLDRHPEGGGYIVIFNDADLDARRTHLHVHGVRLVTDLGLGAFHTLQVHPADAGGCMLEFNRTTGGEDWDGPYYPAGPAWQEHACTEGVTGLAAVEIAASDPAGLAARWAALTGLPLASDGDATALQPEGGTLRFVPAPPGERDGIRAIALQTASAAAFDSAMRLADSCGIRNGNASMRVAGVDIRLLPAA